jgi:ADP-heptose:LPS heptosyltransferase
MPRPLLALAVGSRWLTKRWPPGHFAELARRSQAAFGGTAILVGAPDEVEISREAATLIPGQVLDLAGKTSLPRLAAVLAECDAMLANDTGPLHLAVALGLPVAAPYTCTKVSLTGPYNQLHRAVETNIWCKGSLLKTCDRLECMNELVPDRLWPIVHDILSSWRNQRQIA